MQPLTPPENVELGEREVNAQRHHLNSMCDRTGYHTPQRVIPLAHPFRTNALVGTHRYPDPTNPGSCYEARI